MKILEQQLQERLNSLEQAYKESERPQVDFSVYPEDMRIHAKGSYNAKIIVEAARKIEKECGYGELDWQNSDQKKYIPWFYMSPSAFAFDDSNFGYSFAGAGSGSRLRVLRRETSDHIGRTFPEVWEAVQLK